MESRTPKVSQSLHIGQAVECSLTSSTRSRNHGSGVVSLSYEKKVVSCKQHETPYQRVAWRDGRTSRRAYLDEVWMLLGELLQSDVSLAVPLLLSLVVVYTDGWAKRVSSSGCSRSSRMCGRAPAKEHQLQPCRR